MEQEEVVLLLVQKIVIIVVAEYFELLPTEEDKLASCKYMLRVTKKRALSDSVVSSVHMTEGTKQNLNLFVAAFASSASRHLRLRLLALIGMKTTKYTKKAENSSLSAIEISASREFMMCLVKAMYEFIHSIFSASDEEAVWLFDQASPQLIQFVCQASENQSIIIRNQAQQLFALLLKKVLQLRLPLREEIEVMFIKVALKPLLDLEQKLKSKPIVPEE
jgi:hypothetical protein